MDEPGKKKWGWGGWRPGAGRKPKGEKAGVPHRERPRLSTKYPVHVILRIDKEVAGLLSPESRAALERSFFAGRDRFGFRLNEFAVQAHEIHLIVEATTTLALCRGVKGLMIRISRNVNPTLNRRGRLWSDRWEEHILKTAEEVEQARAILRGAAAKPTEEVLASSGPEAPVAPPRTRLLIDSQTE